MLTCHGIYDHSDRGNIWAQILMNDALSMQEYNPEIPKKIDTIILKCLEKKVDSRTKSVAKLRDEMLKVL